jgi:hypothetical protein
MSAITGETTLLKSVRSRGVVLHDDSFVEYYPEEMRYQYKEEFVEESGRTNVVIAAYTRAQARLKLYS